MSLDDEEVYSASWEDDVPAGDLAPEPDVVHGKAPSLTPAAMLCGFGLSALLASTTRWMLIERSNGPIAIIAGTVAGAALGVGLDRAVRAGAEEWVGRALVAPFVIAPVVSTFVTAIADPEMVIPGLVLAVVAGTIAMPIMYALAARAREARRSRVTSVVGGSDRNAPYRALAAGLSALAALSAVVNLVVNRDHEQILRHARLFEGYSLAVPVDAVAIVAACVGIAVAAADGRARALVERSSELAKRCRLDNTTSSRGALDLGIGDQIHVEQGQADTYRISTEDKAALIGDVDRGLAMLRDAHRSSLRVAGFATCALLVVGLGHVLYAVL